MKRIRILILVVIMLALQVADYSPVFAKARQYYFERTKIQYSMEVVSKNSYEANGRIYESAEAVTAFLKKNNAYKGFSQYKLDEYGHVSCIEPTTIDINRLAFEPKLYQMESDDTVLEYSYEVIEIDSNGNRVYAFNRLTNSYIVTGSNNFILNASAIMGCINLSEIKKNEIAITDDPSLKRFSLNVGVTKLKVKSSLSSAKTILVAGEYDFPAEGVEGNYYYKRLSLVNNLETPVITNATCDIRETSITLNWNTIKNALSYEIQIENCIYPVSQGTNYTHMNLIPNSKYKYRIRALNSSGTSEWSDEIELTTIKPAIISPKIDFSATKVTDTLVSFRWNPVKYAVSYDVEVDGIIKTISSGTEFTQTNQALNSKHKYRIRTISNFGVSAWSDYFELKTLNVAQNAKVNQRLISSNMFLLEFRPVANAVCYRVSVNNGPQFAIGNARTILQQNLTPNTEYKYVIVAIDANGKIIESISGNVKTLSR